jgi:hypothetical protein
MGVFFRFLLLDDGFALFFTLPCELCFRCFDWSFVQFGTPLQVCVPRRLPNYRGHCPLPAQKSRVGAVKH